MKKALLIATTLLCAATLVWATDYNVGTDSELRSAITNGANITVTADIDLSNSTLSIPSNATVTINLGGHTLDRGLTQRGEGGGQVITVREGATLNLSNGTLTGGWGGDSGGINNEGGTANLTNVTITGCTGDDRGGGIVNRTGSTLNMTGGSITNNVSRDESGIPAGGGGIFNASGATATLTNVTITGNETKVYGGGGIDNFGTLTLNGCTITGNTSKANGAGIWTSAGSTLNMLGEMTVADNAASESVASNLFLSNGAVITVTGSLAGSNIGVLMENYGTFTSGFDTNNSGVDPATLFFSDLPMTVYVISTGTEAQMAYGTEVSYIKCSWDEDNKQLLSDTITLHEGNYTVLTSGGNISLASGYYVVRGTVSRGTIDLTGGHTVHLILCDGAKLTANYIHLEYDEYHTGAGDKDSLYIYSQSYGGKMGKLRVDNSGTTTDAGIGTGYAQTKKSPAMGALIVHGGDIYSKGGTNAAGIGGGHGGRGGRVYVYGGRVEAHGGEGAGTNSGAGAGIGSGYFAPAGAVWVYGGEVYAYGGQDAAGIGSGDVGNVMQHDFDKWIHAGWFTMYGGYVEAYGGGNGAGIGGGEYSPGPKNVSIYGGTVKAYGGEDAAGIGGGYYTFDYGISTGFVNIYGGEVYAYGAGEGAGIGGGENGDGAKVKILGGTVVAQAGENETGYKAIGPGRDSDDYGELTLGDDLMVSSERMASAAERHDMCWYRTRVRIEPCDHSHVTYTVDGAGQHDHHISHCDYCLHTDTAEHLFVNGVCTVCGVQATANKVKLYMPHDNNGSFDGYTYDSISTFLIVPGSPYTLPMATLQVPGLKFVGWEASTTVSGATYVSPYTTDTADTLYRTGNKYTVSGDVSFVARYSALDITLLDDGNNGETLSRNDSMLTNSVTLSGRTLYKDGHWNTLCLPFALDSLTGTPLEGATLMQLDTLNTYEGKKTGFDPTTGTLYLYFKDTTAITAGMPYIIKWASGSDIQNPVFYNVTIANVTADVSAPNVTFVGTYSSEIITEADQGVLYVGADNNLYYPNDTMNINACRAYFQLSGVVAQQPSAGVAPLRIVFSTGEENNATDLPHVEQTETAVKFIQDGVLYIRKNDIIYDALGRRVK